MDEHEAQRTTEEGRELLDALGDVPITYGFACELPAAQDEPLSELDTIWHDRFEAVDRDWLVVLNGRDRHDTIDLAGVTYDLPGGAAVVICDDTVLARVTPVDVTWHLDPDTGEPVQEGRDVYYWDDQLLEALHTRLTENGKDLPSIEEIVREKH